MGGSSRGLSCLSVHLLDLGEAGVHSGGPGHSGAGAFHADDSF